MKGNKSLTYVHDNGEKEILPNLKRPALRNRYIKVEWDWRNERQDNTQVSTQDNNRCGVIFLKHGHIFTSTPPIMKWGLCLLPLESGKHMSTSVQNPAWRPRLGHKRPHTFLLIHWGINSQSSEPLYKRSNCTEAAALRWSPCDNGKAR